MSQTMMLVPKQQRASFRERVSRALDAVRSYTINNILSSDKRVVEILGGGGKTDAGILVTAQNAFTFSAVFDAVNQGSSDVAKLPLNLLERREDGGADQAIKDPAYQLLKVEANPEMSAMDFRQTLQAHAMTRKGGFAEIERDGAGRPFALWPITPDRVERKRDGSGPIYYLIDGKDRIPARDMIDIRGLGYDGISGYDVIDKARQAIGLALAAEKFGASFFGNGAGFPGLLGIKNPVGPDSMATFRKHVDESYGPGSWNRFLILDNDPSFTSFGIEPQKAQMNELRTKQVEEVARFFNFPVHKLKNLDRATNNNIEQQDLEYYKGFMLNWTTKWEEECNRKLVSRADRGRLYYKHSFNGFLRADTTARAALYTAMLDRGVFCADDVLELEDRNPQPDGLGKMFLVNSTMVPKDKLEEIAVARTNPAPPAPPRVDPDDDGVTQDDVDAADARAAAAARVAEEMRTLADVSSRRVAELEGAAEPSAAALAEARSRADSETQRANTAELLASETRRLADTLQQQFEAAEAERARLLAAVSAERDGRVADVSRLEDAARSEAARVVDAEAAAERERTRAAAAEEQANAAATSLAERERLLEQERTDRAEEVARLERAQRAEADRAAAAEAAAREQSERAVAAEATIATIEAREAERVAALDATLSTANTDVERLRQEIAAAADRLSAAESARAAAAGAQADAIAQSEQRIAELERDLAAATGVVEPVRAKVEALAAELEAARAAESLLRDQQTEATETHQRLVTSMRDALAATEARLSTADGRVAELERVLDAERTSRRGRVSAEISAHRALVVDIMRRMIERETERARRHQATPEKLRAWLESFYSGHADLMRSALVPAIRIHLAWIGSAEDANQMARRLAERHVDESARQVRVLLDGDADELAASLPALWHRWETDRVATIADALMQKELDHVSER